MNLSTLQIVQPIPEEASAVLTVLGRVGRLTLVYGGIAAAGVVLAPLLAAFGIWGTVAALVGAVVTALLVYAGFAKLSSLFSGERPDAYMAGMALPAERSMRVGNDLLYQHPWIRTIRRKRKKKRRKSGVVLRSVPSSDRDSYEAGRTAARRGPEPREKRPRPARQWVVWSSLLATVSGIVVVGAAVGAIVLAVRHLEEFVLGAGAGLSLSTIAGLVHIIAAWWASTHLLMWKSSKKRRRKKR